MSRVRLLHWNAQEAGAYLELLRTAGYDVEYEHDFRPGMMRSWRESPPDAFVIDLSRLPSHGREIATALRQSPVTRRIPIVFCEGAEDKVRRIRSELPDAVYCGAATLRFALKRAIAKPPRNPIKPAAMMDRYVSRTAAQKLGIKESSSVSLIDPPRDYIKVLGELPAGVELIEEPHASAPVTLCFVRDPHSLQRTLSRVRILAGATKLWIVWPKGGSQASGVTERSVREHALELGLVDYKICSVNEVWSAMLFAAREKKAKA
jgi:CheY-like chemotaxis protein